MARTVFDAFMATAKAAPQNVFLCAPPATGRAYHPAGIELTYGQTRDAVLTLREAYAAAGYGHGHRVALLLENRPEFFLHYLALNALGCSIVPVNPDTGTTSCSTRWSTRGPTWRSSSRRAWPTWKRFCASATRQCRSSMSSTCRGRCRNRGRRHGGA